MLSADQLQERRVALAAADMRALGDTIARRTAPLLRQMPEIPADKALLSVDGGICPADGGALEFDPWSPRAHR
ncbi:MAG TPA: hypothetical protein VFT84_07035, partial [Gemmatimonadales bacterium]|nr:hypothetical protein [Gemmatimonadales bacterium]